MSQTDRPLSRSKRYFTPPPLLRPLNANLNLADSSQMNTEAEKPKTERKSLFDKEKYKRAHSTVQIRAATPPLLVALNVNALPPGRTRGVSFVKNKKFNTKTIEEEIINQGVDLNMFQGKEKWIPIETFDDRIFEDYKPKQWLLRSKRIQGFEPKVVPAKGLYRGWELHWKMVYIYNYNSENGKFSGFWAHDKSQAELSRLEVCFDEEDVNKFVKRLKKALIERKWADTILRYNYCIDRIPTMDGPRIDPEQVKRIEQMVTKHFVLKLEKIDLAKLKEEVAKDYQRAMSKFTFDKYLKQEPDEIIFDSTSLPEYWDKPYEIAESGKVKMERNEDSRDFKDLLKEFSENSLFTMKEAILALKDVRVECNSFIKLSLFDTEFTGPVTLEEFRSRQEDAISRCNYYMFKTWAPRIYEAVRTNFEACSIDLFNLEDTKKKSIPEVRKLGKVIVLTRRLMQDTLLTLMRTSFNNFFGVILEHTPHKVIIDGLKDVYNWYESYTQTERSRRRSGSYTSSSSPQRIKMPPIFSIDIRASRPKKDFEYTVNPNFAITIILDTFDRVLRDLKKVPDPEDKIYRRERRDEYGQKKRAVY